MASSILTSLHSILSDIELLVFETANKPVTNLKLMILRFRLKNLKTFILFATKISDLGGQESLLVRIEDILSSHGSIIHALCLRSSPEFVAVWFGREVDVFVDNIQSLEEEINDWYYTDMLDFPQQSTSLITGEIVEIIDFVLEPMEDFLSFRWKDLHNENLVTAMEALREQMEFLKSFIRFVSLGGLERENLLTHSASVAFHASHLCFRCRCHGLVQEWWRPLKLEISSLLEKIKPVHPKVYQIYTQSLRSRNLSRQLQALTLLDRDDGTHIVVKDFLDSLICNIWAILQLDSYKAVRMKDQLQVLYEGLGFLRTTLQHPPKKSMEKIKDHIGYVVRDAGIMVCSFYQKHVQSDRGLVDLLERIKVIRSEVREVISQVTEVSLPRTSELNFLDSLIENTMKLSSFESEPVVKSYIQTLQEELVLFSSFLGEILELCNEHNQIQDFKNRVSKMAHKAECLVEHLRVGDVSQSTAILEEIGNMKIDALKALHDKRPATEVNNESNKSSHVPLQTSPSTSNEVVGFHDEATSIIDRLTRGSMNLRIVTITGMPGQGKTTLAAKAYNDLIAKCYFHIRAWCLVSQVLDKKKVLLELLNHIDPTARHSCPEMTEQDLTEKLWRVLKGKRYLICLDDVWTIGVWTILQGSFPDDSIGSRIIITSRIHDVAPHNMLDQDPLFLHPLSSSESWQLLQNKLFPEEGCPPALQELGMQIAENCKGLPLTIVTVAGLLAATEQANWKNILDGFSSGVVSSTKQCTNTLDLSYMHLPDFLKPCFLYLGVFPEDQEVPVRRLVQLWIAEGFVLRTDLKSLQDTAEDYLLELVKRSLIVVAKQRSIGGVKTCRVHDLLHEFCVRKAKEKHFCHFFRGYDQPLAFNEPSNMRRLCIHLEPKHFKDSRLIDPHARSLIFFSKETAWSQQTWLDISVICNFFKVLNVLNLEQINLGSVFPNEIELLVQLRYLSIRGKIKIIPSSIGNLSKLETFILDADKNVVSFPEVIWDLQKLKFLYIRSCFFHSGGSLPSVYWTDSVLFELDRISGVIFPSLGIMREQLRKFPNIRKLKCKVSRSMDDDIKSRKILFPDFLSRLESLDLGLSGYLHGNVGFGLPKNLKKLTLSNFLLLHNEISTIGKLPNFEILKLSHVSFSMATWKMEDEEFSKLRFLKLSCLDLVSWTASDDQSTCLQKLIMYRCKSLKEMPSCLEYISTLEMIEVTECSDTLENLVKHIGEEQMSMGNPSLKISIIRNMPKQSLPERGLFLTSQSAEHSY